MGDCVYGKFKHVFIDFLKICTCTSVVELTNLKFLSFKVNKFENTKISLIIDVISLSYYSLK